VRALRAGRRVAIGALAFFAEVRHDAMATMKDIGALIVQTPEI
jgi:hypothetical protein